MSRFVFANRWPGARYENRSRRRPTSATRSHLISKNTGNPHRFLALAIATAALDLFAPAVGHAQDYIVNGHGPITR